MSRGKDNSNNVHHEDECKLDENNLFSGLVTRYRPPIPGLACRESTKDDEDFGRMLVFHCTTSTGKDLQFNCRDSSSGVLVKEFENEKHVSEEERLKGQVDHNFFDPGYTLAGSTGFQIWPGTRLMTEALCWPLLDSDCAKLKKLQEQISIGACNILELGAGIGAVGVALAAMGGHVLQSDLPTLTENAIAPNQALNSSTTNNNNSHDDDTYYNNGNNNISCPAFLKTYEENAVPIDQGWATYTELDWTKPLEDQIEESVLSQIDLIIGCDCLVWKSLEDHTLSQVNRMFELAPQARFLVTYQRRSLNSVFTNLEYILNKVHDKYGWDFDCLAWRSVNCAKDGDAPEDADNDLFLIEMMPRRD